MVEFGQLLILPTWLSYSLVLIPGIVMLVVGRSTNARRRAANLSAGSSTGLVLKAALTTLVLLAIVFYLSLGRGVPWMFALFVGLVLVMNYGLTRTQWGRSMKAVGGNAEARELLEAIPGEVLNRGGSLIAAPDTRVIAQAGEGEETLLAELDLGEVSAGLTNLDTDGHYARPDVFELRVDTQAKDGVVWK